MSFDIRSPKGATLVGEFGTCDLKFATDFGPRRVKQYEDAQKFIDSEVLRGCEPYIPLLTGTLIKSGILATVIGSGSVEWITPYARYQYYLPRPVGTQTGPLRGPLWFERWKTDHVARVIAGAKKIAGIGKK